LNRNGKLTSSLLQGYGKKFLFKETENAFQSPLEGYGKKFCSNKNVFI